MTNSFKSTKKGEKMKKVSFINAQSDVLQTVQPCQVLTRKRYGRPKTSKTTLVDKSFDYYMSSPGLFGLFGLLNVIPRIIWIIWIIVCHTQVVAFLWCIKCMNKKTSTSVLS